MVDDMQWDDWTSTCPPRPELAVQLLLTSLHSPAPALFQTCASPLRNHHSQRRYITYGCSNSLCPKIATSRDRRPIASTIKDILHTLAVGQGVLHAGIGLLKMVVVGRQHIPLFRHHDVAQLGCIQTNQSTRYPEYLTYTSTNRTFA